ncbi:MAG: hypothetical protein SGPRY_011621, partial [Prymnesium sp.]
SQDMQLLLHELLREQRFNVASEKLTLQHVSGEGNVLADLVSRALWGDFELICDALKTRQIHIPLAIHEQAFIQRVTLAYASPIRPALTAAADATANELADRLSRDRTPGRIAASREELYEMALAVETARSDGRNPRTARKDDKAWRDFQEFAQLRGFDPMLRAEWMSSHPERENLKLAGYLLFVSQRMRPRSRDSPAVKPMSVYHRYLSLRRHFAPRLELPRPKAIQMVVHGLVQRFLKHYGIQELRPRRAESMTMRIIERLVIDICVGSRKGESALLPLDTDLKACFTRDCLTWRLAGKVVSNPSRAQLAAVTEGDLARLAPKGAKCDQWGMCYGTEPIILPYHNAECNPARWLADIELRWPCEGQHRMNLPLFCDHSGEPFSLDYATWMDKLTHVHHVDALRTTSLPVMDAHEAIAPWEGAVQRQGVERATKRPPPLLQECDATTPRRPAPPTLERLRDPAAPPPTCVPRPRKRRCSTYVAVDAGSTSGVGRLDHRFPASLSGYKTFWE